MINKETYDKMKELIAEYENNEQLDNSKKPYIYEHSVEVKRTYNPEYGDDKICECGHPYYRHFDSYEDMEACGCKYCSCYDFQPRTKKIYGMIHLSGPDTFQKALDEIKIYEEEGLYGFILENYHGTIDDVIEVLDYLKDNPSTIQVGINILPNEYERCFALCKEYEFISFIQLDYVSGNYINTEPIDRKVLIDKLFDYGIYHVKILGGVWPKYYRPVEGSDLKTDILNGLIRDTTCIVVTGEGTGSETPIEKIKQFREILDSDYQGEDTQLIVGAGLTPLNVREQLTIADGGIVGSTFKPNGRTHQMVDRNLVRVFMEEFRKIK